MTELDYSLFAAVLEGNADATRSLIAAGANPNSVIPGDSNWGSFFVNVTPLMVAAGSIHSNAETIGVLLEKGADLNQRSRGGVSATWYGAGGLGCRFDEWGGGPDNPYIRWGGGDVDRLRGLLDAGGDPNEAESGGRTLFGEACGAGDIDRARLLLERGASVWPMKTQLPVADDLPSTSGDAMERTVSDDPNSSSDEPTYELRYKRSAIPLFLAAESGSVERVRLVLDAGFPPDFECDGYTALTTAASAEIAELLCERGARLGEGSFGFDAIDEIFENEDPAIAAFILSKFPDDEHRIPFLNEKLMVCAGLRMNANSLRLLLELGGDVNYVSPSYGSVLHCACWQGDGNGGREISEVRQVVELLIDKGADINLNLAGWGTPLHQAVVGDWGSPTSTLVLIERNADLEAVSDDDMTALMLAATQGEVECLRLLLAAGVDPKRKVKGRSALEFAKLHLKSWERIVQKPVEGIRLYGQSPEDLLEDRRRTLSEAQEAVRLLDGA